MRFDYTQTTDLQELLWYSVLFTDVEYQAVLKLFHYTNAGNKQHIIKENRIDLRLTRADAFDDIKEGRHIIDVYRHAVKKCFASKQIDKAFRNLLLSVVKPFVPISDYLRKYYVFCFSKNSSNKRLVDKYACKGKKSGMIIGLNALDVENLSQTQHNDRYPISLVDVLYDKKMLSRYMQDLFCRMYQLKMQDDERFSLCKKIAINQLAIYSLVYKAPKFKREQETRLIIDFSKIDPQNTDIIADTNEQYIHAKLCPRALYNTREVIRSV